MVSQSVSFDIDASPEDVWRVAGERWGEVYRLVSRISHSELVGDTPVGEGATRKCTLASPALGMEYLEERLVVWDPPRTFTYELIDPPFPMTRLGNRWTVEPTETGTRLTLAPFLELRGGRLSRPLERFALRRMMRSLAPDIEGMKSGIERTVADTATDSVLR